MSRPERRNLEKEKFWREAIAKYRRSGLTQMQFCDKERLSVNSLNGWLRIIRIRDEEISTKKGGVRHDDAYWWSLFDQWRSSDLSLKEFAVQLKVNYRTLLRWKEKLFPEAESAELSKASCEKTAAPFVPVKIIEEKAPVAVAAGETNSSPVIEVLLKCGRSIRVNGNCQPEFLRELVAVLNLANLISCEFSSRSSYAVAVVRVH